LLYRFDSLGRFLEQTPYQAAAVFTQTQARARLTVRWLLSRAGIISVAVGARTHEQWVDLVRAAQDRLSPETLEQIDAAVAGFGHADAVARAPAMCLEK